MRVGEYKSAMSGSRNGIIVRSTCGRVNLTDATKISIKHYSIKLSRIPLNFCDVVK